MNSEPDTSRGKLLRPFPTRSLKEYLAHQSLHNSQSIENHLSGALEIEVQLGDGSHEVLVVDSCTDIRAQAKSFCLRHNLDAFVQQLLAESIHEQFQAAVEEQSKNKSIYQPQQEDSLDDKNTSQRCGLIEGEISPKPSVYEVDTKTYDSHYKLSTLRPSHITHKKQNRPAINAVSQKICQKIGKENIIQWKRRRSQSKIEAIRREKAEKQSADLKECHFHPKINPISQKVDSQLNGSSAREKIKSQRYKQLYCHYLQLQQKKQLQKQHALLQHPFKPNINCISKLIVENKKSRDKHNHNRSSTHLHCREEKKNDYVPKTNKTHYQRNTEGLPIGQYLYKKAGKKHSRPEMMVKNSFRASEHSDLLVNMLKEKRLKEIFMELTRPPHEYLTPQDIPPTSCLLLDSIRYMAPLLEQIVALGVSLSQQNFVEAGSKMIACLTPAQRHELLFRKQQQVFGQPDSMTPSIRSHAISRQVSGDLYTRGVQMNRAKQCRLERSRQAQARDELRMCTFRPVLHR